jgi:hypothetical protein
MSLSLSLTGLFLPVQYLCESPEPTLVETTLGLAYWLAYWLNLQMIEKGKKLFVDIILYFESIGESLIKDLGFLSYLVDLSVEE